MTDKTPQQHIVICHSCGCFGLTTKVCCPWCEEVGMVDYIDYTRSNQIEQQMLSALSMWQRLRVDRSSEGDNGRKAFKIMWDRCYSVLKFWDKAIKICRIGLKTKSKTQFKKGGR